MFSTLIESNRRMFPFAEWVLASLVAHSAVVGLMAGVTRGGPEVSDQRESIVLFLLPPDRVDQRPRQSDEIEWGKIGGDLEDGSRILESSEGQGFQLPAYGARKEGKGGGARGESALDPQPVLLLDSAFSVLEVDEIVQRYETSAAPIYPPELAAAGTPGEVRASYVVDTTGRVDTTTIRVVRSTHARFTASVREALALMRFRPAKRGGKKVRQLVEQNFRFRVAG